MDIESVKFTIKEKAPTGLLLVGFTLRDDLFDNFKPHCHIHLSTGQTKDQIVERCIVNRQKSKNFSSLTTDRLNVKEVVYPFYVETITKSTINHIVEVFDNNGERRSVDDIISEIMQIL